MTAALFFQLGIALVLAGIVSSIAGRLKLLTSSGALASTLVGFAIMGAGGWSWALPLLTFFFSSAILSRIRGAVRGNFEAAKGSCRDAAQVLANGGVAATIAIISLFSAKDLFPIYLGALAAAAADTWSTEIGLLWGKKPRSIVSLRHIPIGASGGVTLVGFEGAILGAMSIAQIGFLAEPKLASNRLFLMIIFAGFLGSFFDSILGATLQQRRSCGICGKQTEKRDHCGKPTVHSGGWRWLNNDAVNFVATAAGAATIALALQLI